MLWNARSWTDPGSHVRLHYNTISLGGTPGNSCFECATPFFQILTLCHTKKGHFPHPCLNLASKIHTRFQTWPLRNYVSMTKTYTPVVPLNTLPDGQSLYLFSDWNSAKTIPSGWHIPRYGLYWGAPPENSVGQRRLQYRVIDLVMDIEAILTNRQTHEKLQCLY